MSTELLPDDEMDALEREAAASEVRVVEVTGVELGAASALADTAKQLASLAILGEARMHPDRAVRVQLAAEFGPFVYVVPLQGSVSLAGIHHFRLPGALARPAVRVKKLIGNRWHVEGDDALAKRLTGSRELEAAAKQLPFAKQTLRGAQSLDWTIQASSLGDGTTHLAVQAGSFHTQRAAQCLTLAVTVARTLRPLLDEGVGTPGWYYPLPLLELVYED